MLLDDLKIKIKSIPSAPGVYLMKDIDNTVIYIGKSVHLKNRVRSYFSGSDDRYQIKFLMKRVSDIETIITQNEDQAFVLERDLINKHKPRYNIRLKDDKNYVSIRLDRTSEYPKFNLTRKIIKDKSIYFGPYPSTYKAKELLNIIQTTIPLRTCSDKVFNNRVRPCLEYQIKRCLAPCCLEVSKEDYQYNLSQAIKLLEGKNKEVITDFEKLMNSASSSLDFERAALYRDRIELLNEYISKDQTYLFKAEDKDIFDIYRDNSICSVSILNIKLGKISNTTNYILENVEISDEDFLESVISQYYENKSNIVQEIIIPFEFENLEIVKKHFKKKFKQAVSFIVPKKGTKYRLLKLANLNAKENYLSSYSSKYKKSDLIAQFAKKIGLKQVPRTIELLDISNLGNTNIVGAIVSFYDGKADKSKYKKYILDQEKADDFAAIYEVISRRLKRGDRENDLPDLIIIDGGIGQLNAAIAASDDVGVVVDIVSLAKKRLNQNQKKKNIEKEERIFIPNKDFVELKADLPVTNLISYMRDEVHRFVINFHRQRRDKELIKSVLSQVKGLTEKKIIFLLKEFGSVKRLINSDKEKIVKFGKVSLEIASKIKRLKV